MAEYPYIQTLHGFHGSVGAYSIQTLGENNRIVVEEELIVAFGPIGRINIFVGANNSGKSRFLRHLANQSRFVFLPHERAHCACNQFLKAARALANINGAIEISSSIAWLQEQIQGFKYQEEPIHPITNLSPEERSTKRFETEMFRRIQSDNRDFIASRLQNYMGTRKV